MIFAFNGVNPSAELISPVVDGVDGAEDEYTVHSTVRVHQESIHQCYYLVWGGRGSVCVYV